MGQSSFNGFIRPIDNDEQLQQQTPCMQKQTSSKSPSNFHSPVILDFLDDDAYFGNLEEKQHKSKTEFVRRERQESEDSYGQQYEEEEVAQGVTQDYLNFILPNNSIKFTKPTQSVRTLLLL